MKGTIKYSLCMRANPMDPDEAKKAYATVQNNGTINLSELADHILSHGSVFTKGTILGVLKDMVTCSREALMEGNYVELGDLGKFRVTVRSEGADSLAEFTTGNIKELNVNFEPGPGLTWNRKDLNFELTTTRKVQAAAKAAEIKGETSADWSQE